MGRKYTETIAAVSTALSSSGIGIIRISGSDSFEIADKIYAGKNNKRLTEQKSHTIHYGFIEDAGKTIDQVLVMLMRAPHSYTGEDTVEINCHGGIYVVKKILETVIKYGARPAEPGEFTKRAFLNGKLDLSQAEAVGDLIASQNEYARQSSVNQLKGSIREKIDKIRKEIIYHTAFIETALDDPEHISVDGYGEKLKSSVTTILKEIEALLSTCDSGRIIKEGIRTVIVGKPNAGKSSLLNALLREERAIVTDIAGTTRDILEEQVNLQGISLNVIDTAGIRNTEDIVESIGVERARENVKKADLILYVIDASCPLDENDKDIFSMICEKKTIILLNKSDLSTVVTKENILDELKLAEKEHKMDNNEGNYSESVEIIEISAKKQNGISELEKKVKEMFFEGSIEMGMPEDFYSIDLMDAYETLGSITGETVGEDLVNEIFSKFCMGK